MKKIIVLASAMIISQKRSVNIKEDGHEGWLLTNFQIDTISHLSGFNFNLSLVDNEGKIMSLEFILTRPVKKEELDRMFFFNLPQDVDAGEVLDQLEKLFAGSGLNSSLMQ